MANFKRKARKGHARLIIFDPRLSEDVWFEDYYALALAQLAYREKKKVHPIGTFLIFDDAGVQQDLGPLF